MSDETKSQDEVEVEVKRFRVEAVRKGYFQGVLRFPGAKFTVTEAQFSDADRDTSKRRGKGWMRRLPEAAKVRVEDEDKVPGRKSAGLPPDPKNRPDVKRQLERNKPGGGAGGAGKPSGVDAGGAPGKAGGRESDKPIG